MTMPLAVQLLTFLAVAVLLIVTDTVEESCQDFESVELCDMAPGSQLEVDYGRCGIKVMPQRASLLPKITFYQAQDHKKYVLVMVDPDAPSAEKPKFRYWRHFVMSDIAGSSLRTGFLEGKIWTEYNGPSPPQNSGPHRYQYFLFEQSYELNSAMNLGNNNRAKWNLRDFVKDNNLCDSFVAGYEFISEN